jgi:hypothetical protein
MDRFLRYPEFLLLSIPDPASSWHYLRTLIEIRTEHDRPNRSQPWQPPLHTTTFPWSYGNDFPAIDRQPPLLHLVILSTRFNRWFSVDDPNFSVGRILIDYHQPSEPSTVTIDGHP